MRRANSYIFRRLSNPYRTTNKKKRRGYLKLLSLLPVLLILLAVLSEVGLASVSQELTQESAKRHLSETVNSAIDEIFDSEREDALFVELTKDGDGQISSIQADAEQLNKLKAKLTKRILKQVNRKAYVGIPCGSLTDIRILNGRGFPVPIKLSFEGTVDVRFETRFISAGINQTCHRIIMQVEASAVSESRNYAAQADYTTELVISETVIVGEVPEWMLKEVDAAIEEDDAL